MIVFIVSVIGLIIVDQFIKYFVSVNLVGNTIETFLANFTYVEHQFSILGFSLTWLSILISIAFIIFFVIFFLNRYSKVVRSRMNIITFTMIIAGGISNLIDNIVRGFVVDYIQLNYVFTTFVFNFADILIVFGVVLLVIMYLIEVSEEKVDSMPEGGAYRGSYDSKQWFKKFFKENFNFKKNR